MIALKPLRILLRCELTSLSRCRAFRMATVVYVAALTLLVFGWAATDTFTRAREINSFLLALTLPWIAVRCASAERGDALVMLAAVLGVRPSQILIARGLAVLSALAIVALSGAPVVILAHRIAAAPASAVWRAFAVQLISVVAAAAIVVAGQQLWRGRVRIWLAAGAITAAVTVLAEAAQ